MCSNPDPGTRGSVAAVPQRVSELWRYPVKSMMGERVEQAELTALGVVGDRAWATRDEVRGGIRGAKKIGPLMQLAARYLVEPVPGRVTAAEITLPDGSTLMSDAPDVNERVSAAIEHPVTVWPLRPASDLEHYRHGPPDHPDFLEELRALFDLEPDEPFPNLAAFPVELIEYESLPGTYYDAFPVLLVTDASLAALQALAPDSVIDVRRFRPNLLVETGQTGFVEDEWVGRRLRVGDAVLEIPTACPRCVMITRESAEFPQDRSIMRTLVKHHRQELGVYANVVEPGVVRTGDEVSVLA
jgi:uncharacterized protein